MEEVISMTARELSKLDIVRQLELKVINQKQAADILGISTRQVKRNVKQYKENGVKGLLSKKRGEASNQQISICMFTAVF